MAATGGAGKNGRKDVIVVRYVDDLVIGFESKADAEACLEALRARSVGRAIANKLGIPQGSRHGRGLDLVM